MAIKQYKNQQGVVLLSVLAFLILILLLLKVTLQSGRMESFKTGIHYEILKAQEAAEMGQTAARDFILAGGYHGNVTPYIDKSTISGCNPNANSEACMNAVNNLAFDYWLNLQPSDFPKGSFTSDSPCQKDDKNQPFWKCVDWNAGISDSNPFPVDLSSGEYSPYVANTDAHAGIAAPRFVVQLLSRGDEDSTNSILFRVYSVGFGQGGDKDNPTVKMVESTYLLAKRHDDE